jgi:hypothetical protein
MEAERQQPEDALDQRIAADQPSPAVRASADPPRTQRRTSHEDREHQALRVRRRPEENPKVVRPDRLVDQPGKAGSPEHDDQRRPHTLAPSGEPCALAGTGRARGRLKRRSRGFDPNRCGVIPHGRSGSFPPNGCESFCIARNPVAEAYLDNMRNDSSRQ